MMHFLSQSKSDQKTFIIEAAARRGISAVIIEKDFWVCLTLEKLFQSKFGSHITFKGGTSLSKVYGIIERFSEDIDLTIDKNFVNSFSNATSHKPDKISKQSKKVIASHLLPELQAMLGDYGDCTLSDEDPQTILFHYPSVIEDHLDYIQKQVRIELGARGDREPSNKMSITPYIAETLRKVFEGNQPEIKVTALAAERTFWEKVTILHSINHQPEEKSLRERMSRHYHDVYMFSQNKDHINNALKYSALLEVVVRHKQDYFKDSWNWYGSAKIGSLALTPPDHLAKELENDYNKTKIMLFESDPVTYQEMIINLEKLEKRINQLK